MSGVVWCCLVVWLSGCLFVWCFKKAFADLDLLNMDLTNLDPPRLRHYLNPTRSPPRTTRQPDNQTTTSQDFGLHFLNPTDLPCPALILNSNNLDILNPALAFTDHDRHFAFDLHDLDLFDLRLCRPRPLRPRPHQPRAGPSRPSSLRLRPPQPKPTSQNFWIK